MQGQALSAINSACRRGPVLLNNLRRRDCGYKVPPRLRLHVAATLCSREWGIKVLPRLRNPRLRRSSAPGVVSVSYLLLAFSLQNILASSAVVFSSGLPNE